MCACVCVERENEGDRQQTNRPTDKQAGKQREGERVNISSGLKVKSVRISSVSARQSDRLDKSGQAFILCLLFIITCPHFGKQSLI